MDGTKSRAFRSRLTTMLRALPCTRARVTRDSYESPSSPAPRRTASRDRVILLVVVLCLRCGFKVHSERDLLPPAGYKITHLYHATIMPPQPAPRTRLGHARSRAPRRGAATARPHSDSSRAARTGAPRAASRRSSPPHDRLGHPPRASTRPRGTARRGGAGARRPLVYTTY